VRATFHGLTFTIDPGRAFTPRAMTERLVDAALARVAGRSVCLADVGTGVGGSMKRVAAAVGDGASAVVGSHCNRGPGVMPPDAAGQEHVRE
jgi:methylase of polypeptide subunit release factors